ncbi:MAG TPA: hypothetical protein VF857_05360, partial [Spirochaetota bacterium]
MRTFAIVSALVLFSCGFAFTQDKTADQPKKAEEPAKTVDTQKNDPFPPFAVSTDLFKLPMPTFSKKIDPKGRGELMEVVFELTNTEDTPRDLYIFVLASHEEQKWVYNSFRTKRTVPEKVDIDLFAPDPSDRANFEYEI